MDKTTETPAVGGIPPQRSVTNSRMAYLSHKDNAPKQKKTTLNSVRSQEGQVFERLAKQAEIHQNMMREKKQQLDSSIIDPETGKEFFKPQINKEFK